MRRYGVLMVVAAALLCVAPALAAQGLAGSTAEQAAAVNLLGQQSFASLLLSFFMPRVFEFFKRWDRIPWLREGARRANRIGAIGISVLQGSGLTWAYQSGALGIDGASHGWQFVIGSKHSSIEEWAVACLFSFAAQQYFYEQLPATQADAMARAFTDAARTLEAENRIREKIDGGGAHVG